MDPIVIDESVFIRVARLARVKHYVGEHLADPLPLEVVAVVAGLEKTYFSTYFRSKTGIGYQRWLCWVRVQRALELMQSRELCITAIAFEAGFGDLRTFERACRVCTGQCPRDVRKHSAAWAVHSLPSNERCAAPTCGCGLNGADASQTLLDVARGEERKGTLFD